MSQQNQARHQKIAAQTTAIITNVGNSKVPSKKQKEDAKQTLYLNRI
jgi:hypothetical protein